MKTLNTTLLVSLAAVYVSAGTVTLQQGVGGYSGCTDSYIESNKDSEYNGMTTNHGDSKYIAVGSCLYDKT